MRRRPPPRAAAAAAAAPPARLLPLLLPLLLLPGAARGRLAIDLVFEVRPRASLPVVRPLAPAAPPVGGADARDAAAGCPDDPLYADQWHLPLVGAPAAWATTRGAGARVVVVDDGAQFAHPDLAVDAARSFGWDAEGARCAPCADSAAAVHGTAVAGVAGATRGNGRGGCGLAPAAGLAAVRLIGDDGRIAESQLVEALAAWEGDPAAVLTCSWGPPDDGRVAGPGLRASYARSDAAMARFAAHGRAGRGGVLVFAAGNGGPADDSNDDGFVAHAATLAVGSVGDGLTRTYYSERGACLDLVAPSSGGARGITTTDLVHGGGLAPGNATAAFGGTSAAAPLAAAAAALVLAARPDLGARDVRALLAATARRVDAADASWTVNAAGVAHSDWYGHGMVDAAAAVALAPAWVRLPPAERVCAAGRRALARPLATAWADVELPPPAEPLGRLDRAEVHVDVEHPRRSDVELRLVSPAGTEVPLVRAPPPGTAQYDVAFVARAFVTKALVNESAPRGGTWRLRARDATARGVLREVGLCVVGDRGGAAAGGGAAGDRWALWTFAAAVVAAGGAAAALAVAHRRQRDEAAQKKGGRRRAAAAAAAGGAPARAAAARPARARDPRRGRALAHHAAAASGPGGGCRSRRRLTASRCAPSTRSRRSRATPWRTSSKVGTRATPHSTHSASCSSTSTLTTQRASPAASAMSAIDFAICSQGPHHAAV